MDIAFGPSGFMCLFHLGVLHALQDMKCDIKTITGVSGGAIVGYVHYTDTPRETVLECIFDSYEKYKNDFFSGITPSLLRLRSYVVHMFGKMNHSIPTKNKLNIVSTRVNGNKLETVYFNEFHTEKDVFKALDRSCNAVPFWKGTYDEHTDEYIDGGFSWKCPKEQIRVSIVRGHGDIYPSVFFPPLWAFVVPFDTDDFAKLYYDGYARGVEYVIKHVDRTVHVPDFYVKCKTKLRDISYFNILSWQIHILVNICVICIKHPAIFSKLVKLYIQVTLYFVLKISDQKPIYI